MLTGDKCIVETITLNIPRYPMLRALVRYGAWLPAVAAFAVVAAGIAVAVHIESTAITVAGVAAGLLVFAVVRTTVELVTLVTDMLLPK
jgi:hypothetical protein